MSPVCTRFSSAEFAVACSELKLSVTTFVFDADVTRFCSNLTVSEPDPQVNALSDVGDIELDTRLGLCRDTVPDTGGGESESGKVTRGSPHMSLLPPSPQPTLSSSSMELRRRLLKFIAAAFERFFISVMLDLSSERSDFMDDAFISLEVMWWTRCEDVDEEDVVLATRDEDVVDELLVNSCCWGQNNNNHWMTSHTTPRYK